MCIRPLSVLYFFSALICQYLAGTGLNAQGTNEPEFERSNLLHEVSTSKGGTNYHPQLVKTDSGGFFAVFSSRRLNSTFENLYFQLIDRHGKPKFFQDALPISPQGANQKNPQVVSDGAGGIYVCWQERRTGGTRDRLYVQRIDSRGERLWATSGLDVSDAFYRQRNAVLVVPSDGSLIVVWTEDRLRQSGEDLWAQRFSPSGERLWTPNGIALSLSAGIKKNPGLLWDSSGYWYAVWQERRGKKSWKLFGQKFNLRGERQWNDRGLALTPETKGNCENPRIIGDGFNGLMCVYENQHKASNHIDLFFFRLGRFGDVVHHQALCETVDDQKDALLLMRDSLTFVYWMDYRSGKADIYGQCIRNFNGQLLWSLEGRPAVSREGDQRLIALIPVGFGNEHGVLWDRGGRLHQVPDLFLTRFDSTQTWSSLPRAIPTQTNYGERFSLSWTQSEPSKLWYAWADVRSSEASFIRFNGLDSKLALTGEEAGFLLLNPNAPQQVRVEHPMMGADRWGNWIITWADDRLDASQSDIWYQSIDAKGRQLTTSSGQLICGMAGLQSVPQLFVNEHYIYIGWMDRRNQDDDLYLQRLDRNGKSRWEAGGLALCTARGTQNNLCMVRGPQGGACTFWTDARSFNDLGFDLYQQAFDSSGTPFFPKDGGPLAAQANYQNNLSVSCDVGHQEIHSFWMDDRDGTYQIYAQISSLQGRPMGPPGGIRLGKSSNHQRFPHSVSIDSLGSFAIWSEELGSQGRQVVKVQGLRNDLSLCWPGDGLSFPSQAKRQLAPQLLAGTDCIYAAWLENDSPASKTASLRISARAFDSSPLWISGQLEISPQVRVGGGFQMVQTDSLLHVFFIQDLSANNFSISWHTLAHGTGKLIQKREIAPSNESQIEAFHVKATTDGRLALLTLERKPDSHDQLWLIHLQ